MSSFEAPPGPEVRPLLGPPPKELGQFDRHEVRAHRATGAARDGLEDPEAAAVDIRPVEQRHLWVDLL